MASQPRVRVRRVYDGPDPADGRRVLVDRIWPRGLSKEAAAVDEWLRAVAPSAELRRWYGHDPARYAGFLSRYEAELRDRERFEALAHLRKLTLQGPVTLLTATRDVAYSHAAVLAGHLSEEDRPGDLVCLLRRVCPACGAVADADPPTTCPSCHREIPAL